MKLVIAVAVGLCAARASADPARCVRGLGYAQHGDLPRAALYLDGCDEVALPDDVAAKVARAIRDVRKQLEASELSKLDIVTTPEGLVAEIDALPGERFVTPATVWVHAGRHEVRVARDAAALATTAIAGSVEVKPHAHATIVLAVGVATAAPTRAGTADFTDDATPDVESGSPPDAKHGTLVPQKYLDGGTTGGPPLRDPLASVAPPPRRLPAGFVSLRAGAGAFDAGLGPAIALQATAVAPWQDRATATLPFVVAARADASRRGSGQASLGVTAVVGKVIAAPASAWLAAAAGVRAGTELGMTARRGLDGVVALELALRQLPVVVGARYERGLGVAEQAVVVEVGVNLRVR